MIIQFYCNKCGKVLEKKEESIGFNRLSGKEIVESMYLCPDYQISNGHDSIKEDSSELKEIIHQSKLEEKAKEYKEKEKRVQELIKELETLGTIVTITNINGKII